MQTRRLGNTGLDLPILSFGASSLGAEFRAIDVNEALRSARSTVEEQAQKMIGELGLGDLGLPGLSG